MKDPLDSPVEREYPHWNRIYLLVIVYTILLIAGLWLLSRQFN